MDRTACRRKGQRLAVESEELRRTHSAHLVASCLCSESNLGCRVPTDRCESRAQVSGGRQVKGRRRIGSPMWVVSLSKYSPSSSWPRLFLPLPVMKNKLRRQRSTSLLAVLMAAEVSRPCSRPRSIKATRWRSTLNLAPRLRLIRSTLRTGKPRLVRGITCAGVGDVCC